MIEQQFRVYVKSVLPEETGVYEPDYLLYFADGSVDKVFATKNHKSYKFKDDTCEFTLLPYIGLKDKNDIQIFKGDIVSMIDRHANPYEGVVTFCDGMWTIDDGILIGGHMNSFDQREVIGNMYDNPELLKVKHE